MSRLTDYSKFDHLDTDDEDDDSPDSHTVIQGQRDIQCDRNQQFDQQQQQDDQELYQQLQQHELHATPFVRNKLTKRWQFGMAYEWEQGLSEVTVHVPLPPGMNYKSSDISCKLHANYVYLGLVGHDRPYFCQENATLAHPIEITESTWTIEEAQYGNNSKQRISTIVLYLQKANKGVVWDCVFVNGSAARLNEAQLEEERQELMRQRWQEENAGLDLSDAEFNGSAPDPRTYMGGVNYNS